MKASYHITYKDYKHTVGEGFKGEIIEGILDYLRDCLGRVIYPVEKEECRAFTGWIHVDGKYMPLVLPDQILSYHHLYGYIQGRYFSE